VDLCYDEDLEIRGAGDLWEESKVVSSTKSVLIPTKKNQDERLIEKKMNLRIYIEESNIETKEYVKDLQIDTDFELLFSDEYINNVSERLSLYELGTVKRRGGNVQVDEPFWSMPPRASFNE
jgi:transcription-repair coupling factor (superfamily II helicase)